MTRRPPDYLLLWCVALLSLAIGISLVVILATARGRAADGLRVAAEAAHALRGASIDYVVPVREALPVSLTVPISATILVPINTTLPVDTEFKLTLRTPLGDYPVSVPVQSAVPVNMTTSVPISLSVPISSSIPVALDLPVRISLADTPIAASLQELEDYLTGLAADLETFPFSRPASP